MIEDFPDRRDQLFGRETTLRDLTDRAQRTGLTAVVARPLMGKTWTLQEVARRLSTSGGCLVGYHESKGAENSHLLYAVLNLYTRWLNDSSMREQAISLWKRHKDGLVPRAGQIVGSLFDNLVGQQFSAGVGSIVRTAFDGLAGAQKDLVSGGMRIEPLAYDEARSLTSVVASTSQRGVVLILDAWEKSPSSRAEFETLEAFLKHREDWPQTHVLLAIRHPELESTQASDQALRRARDLCTISRAARLYELPSMDQGNVDEGRRIVSYVRNAVPAARDETDAMILESIDGYPGVLDFWLNDRTEMRTPQDLRNEAANAHALRYLELDRLLDGLDGEQRSFAARLALLPRLEPYVWPIFRDLLLIDQSDAYFHALIDEGVLIDESFPAYGHDTRHTAARRWFLENQRSMFRRTSEEIIASLASKITGFNNASVSSYIALAGCSQVAQPMGLSEISRCLCWAALAAFGEEEDIYKLDFDRLYPQAVQLNRSFAPLIGGALMNRGRSKFSRGERDKAIADFTAVIGLPGAPAEHVGAALVCRGTTHRENGNEAAAFADFGAAIAWPGTAAADAAAALVARGITYDDHDDKELAFTDYTAAIELASADPYDVALALVNRGIIMQDRGERASAFADYSSAIELPDASINNVTRALVCRGILRELLGESEKATADYTTVIELPNGPDDEVARALVKRGLIKERQGDGLAIADYTAAIQLPNASPEPVAAALVQRGDLWLRQGESEKAIADYTAAIGLPNVNVEAVAMALVARGLAREHRSEQSGALADYTAAIVLPNAPADIVTTALLNRGQIHRQRTAFAEALADFSAVIELPDAATAQIAEALVNRGLIRLELQELTEALADYTAAIVLPNAPADIVTTALLNRGQIHRQRTAFAEALADFSAVIELPDAATAQIAEALVNRGLIRLELEELRDALADFSAVIELPNAPSKEIVEAFVNRGLIHGELKELAEALADFNAVIELPDAATEQIAEALVGRGDAKRDGGDIEGAIADYSAAAELPGAPGEIVEYAVRLTLELDSARGPRYS